MSKTPNQFLDDQLAEGAAKILELETENAFLRQTLSRARPWVKQAAVQSVVARVLLERIDRDLGRDAGGEGL